MDRERVYGISVLQHSSDKLTVIDLRLSVGNIFIWAPAYILT